MTKRFWLALAATLVATAETSAQNPPCPAPSAPGFAMSGPPQVIAYASGTAFYMGFTPSSASSYYMAGPYYRPAPTYFGAPPAYFNGRPFPGSPVAPVPRVR
jgi:hypothetical protein